MALISFLFNLYKAFSFVYTLSKKKNTIIVRR